MSKSGNKKSTESKQRIIKRPTKIAVVVLTVTLLLTSIAMVVSVLLPVQNSANMTLAEADKVLDRSEMLTNVFIGLVGLQLLGLMIVVIYERRKPAKKQSEK